MADRLAAFQKPKEEAPKAEPARTAGSSRDLARARSAVFEKKVGRGGEEEGAEGEEERRMRGEDKWRGEENRRQHLTILVGRG